MVFKKGSQRAKKKGISTSGQLNRIAMYISILCMDLTVLRSRLVLEQDEYVKNVYARQLVILIYEFIQNYPSVFDQQFREIIGNLPNGEEHIEAFHAIGKDINSIRKRRSNMLKEIRNCIAAHRDKDGERQYDTIRELSIETFIELTSKLHSIILNIINKLRKIEESYTYSPLMVREIANNVERIVSAERRATTDNTSVNSKWIGQEFEEGLKLNPFPNELIYPNAKGEKLQITTNGKEKEIILSTMDNLNKVDNYYEHNLPKNGWKKVIEGSYKNSKKSSLYFEKGNREALINISPNVGDKSEIIVLLRPAN